MVRGPHQKCGPCFCGAPSMGGNARVQIPSLPWSWEAAAQGKDVHCTAESQGRPQQWPGAHIGIYAGDIEVTHSSVAAQGGWGKILGGMLLGLGGRPEFIGHPGHIAGRRDNRQRCPPDPPKDAAPDYICVMTALPFPHSRCARCRHLRTTENKRGSVFMLCDRNREEPAFPKYPPQPVHACPGFEPAE